VLFAGSQRCIEAILLLIELRAQEIRDEQPQAADAPLAILANCRNALIRSADEWKPISIISPNTASGVYSGWRSQSTSQLPTTQVQRGEKYSRV
jgi:hypothetical protein